LKGWTVALAAALLAGSSLAAGAASAQAVIRPDGGYEYPKAQYKNSTEHYEALKRAAKGGVKKTWANVPDWSGIYVRDGVPPAFDPKQTSMIETTAKLTPEYQRRFDKVVAAVKGGAEWDSLSYCLPPGMPRWLPEPFLREFIARPDQVWLINELVNDIRRIYTDGRGHTPADEAYPLWNGDSIGFWDGDALVIHTTQLRAGQYMRSHPEHSDKVEVVERWRKRNADVMEADVTVYDPEGLMEPWHVVHTFSRVKEPADLRIRYWSCEENNNVVNQSGATNFVLPGEAGYKDPNTLGGEGRQ
jgi:hypothetical protein